MKDLTKNDRATDLGVVRINNDAIATIASTSALEVKGVFKMGGGFGNRLHDLFIRKAGSRGVRICLTNSEVKLVVSIIVDYGMDIPKVADEVQENVKRTVERMTGLVLSGVDVVVEGVHAQMSADTPLRQGK